MASCPLEYGVRSRLILNPFLARQDEIVESTPRGRGMSGRERVEIRRVVQHSDAVRSALVWVLRRHGHTY